jgi:hypothetical protein
MRRHLAIVIAVLFPAALAAQSPTSRPAPDGVMLSFQRFADIFGSRLVAALDSIPASRYDYRPTPVQQSIGYIAQHLESANYSLCERVGTMKWSMTARDSLADTVKARWPKDTLVARLKSSLAFCDSALEQAGPLNSAALASTLLAFETDLAEHYSQLATYMRLIGMVPPSALAPRMRTAIDLPTSALRPYAGTYQLSKSVDFLVTMEHDVPFIRSTVGGPPARLWPESHADFFVKEVDAQVTFTRDGSGKVSGLILHQYGRDRLAKKIE